MSENQTFIGAMEKRTYVPLENTGKTKISVRRTLCSLLERILSSVKIPEEEYPSQANAERHAESSGQASAGIDVEFWSNEQ